MKTVVACARFGVLPLALAGVFPTWAQPRESVHLPQTEVTATRVAQALEDVLADVSVVDRATIERSGATGLADVLARLPGVEFQRNGGPGASTSVFVRGGETRFTAVYVDGVRIDSQATGGASWQNIPLGLVERIEVVRGPAAAVYGSDALSGVVQIFTRQGQGASTGSIGIGYGTYGTKRWDAVLSGSQADFDYALGVLQERSDGFNARTVATQNPDDDGYESKAGSVRLGYRLAPGQRLELHYLRNELDSQYDGSANKDDHSLQQLTTEGVNWQAQWSPLWSSRVGYTHSRDRYETQPSPYLTLTDLKSYLLYNELHLGAHLLTAVLERKEDQLENAPINRGRSQDALALGYGWMDKVHALQLNARHDQDSEFGGNDTASAAYGYRLSPQWRATASLASAFRVPTLYHRFSDYGSPTLLPEKAENAELGLRFAQGTTSAGVVVYRNRVSNLITFGASGPCVSAFGCYANTARAVYEGMTWTAQQQWGDVQLNASLDLQDPRDDTTGKRLARRARQHAALALGSTLAGWSWNAEAQFSGERFDDAANTKELAGYSLFNLSASTALGKTLSLLARLENLTDKSYELASTYRTSGRTLMLGIKWLAW